MVHSESLKLPYDETFKDIYEEFKIEDRPVGTVIYRARASPNVNGNHPDRAVKVFPARALTMKKPHNIRNEAGFLSSLQHTNIVELVSIFYDPQMETYELHTPYIDLPVRSLLDNPHFASKPPPAFVSNSTNPFPNIPIEKLHHELSRSIAYQLCNAVAHLHKQDPPIAHRDINPGNLLLTRTGLLKLVDFGVSWSPEPPNILIHGEETDSVHLEWTEDPGNMCCQVATGPYRAPELMYTPRVYDPVSTDLWSLGVTIALFFAPLKLLLDESDESDSSEEEKVEDPGSGFIYGKISEKLPITLEWAREPLFDASRGEIGLLWSIFKTLGTPNQDTWPEFSALQQASSITFREAPKQDLEPLLPHLPHETHPMQLIESLLRYSPSSRLVATKALEHSWFTNATPLLFPRDYRISHTNASYVSTLEGFDIPSLLHTLIQRAEADFIANATPRDEWD